MAIIELSYREIGLLKHSQYLLGNDKETFEEHSKRAKLAYQLEQKLQNKVGRISFDRIKGSNLTHSIDQSKLRSDISKGSDFPEDIKYEIDVSLQEETIIAKEISPLRQIEKIIGREQFSNFCERQGDQYKMVVVNPDKQISLDENGQYKFTPSIAPIDVVRADKAANILGDREALREIKIAQNMIAEAAGVQSFDSLTRMADKLYQPIIDSRVDTKQHAVVRDVISQYAAIEKELGSRTIPLLSEYRRDGGNAVITNPNQLSVEPNENGSLRLREVSEDNTYKYHQLTPKDLSRWVYGAQILGLSDREKKEIVDTMSEMVDVHNEGGSKTRGNFKKEVNNFGELQTSNPNNSYTVVMTGEQNKRKDKTLDKLSLMAAAFDKNELSDLFRRQISASKDGNAIRITDLGQIKKTPSGLEVTPIKDFRALSPEVQAARTDSISKMALNRVRQSSTPVVTVQSQQRKSTDFQR